MCGIVGLFLKNPDLQDSLGAHFSPMLIEMTSRGPDSAGFALYRNPVPPGEIKFTLADDNPVFDWNRLASTIASDLHAKAHARRVATHAVLSTDADEHHVRNHITTGYPSVRIVGAGHTIEIFKEVGAPADVSECFDLPKARGTHAIGHTRMATESAVTTAGSHPFATGEDLCLVHNGSLSNHNRLRDELKREGLEFFSDNDSEVAAGYLTLKIRKGATLREALESAFIDLDGFYTFCVGTHDGFAVVRDSIACKHAVLAETDDWVAMATEFRAIAHLPGAKTAKIWEPEPRTVYFWGGEQ